MSFCYFGEIPLNKQKKKGGRRKEEGSNEKIK